MVGREIRNHQLIAQQSSKLKLDFHLYTSPLKGPGCPRGVLMEMRVGRGKLSGPQVSPEPKRASGQWGQWGEGVALMVSLEEPWTSPLS